MGNSGKGSIGDTCNSQINIMDVLEDLKTGRAISIFAVAVSKEIQASHNNFIKSIRSEATKTISTSTGSRNSKKFMHASDYDALLRIKKQKQL